MNSLVLCLWGWGRSFILANGHLPAFLKPLIDRFHKLYKLQQPFYFPNPRVLPLWGFGFLDCPGCFGLRRGYLSFSDFFYDIVCLPRLHIVLSFNLLQVHISFCPDMTVGKTIQYSVDIETISGWLALAGPGWGRTETTI